MSFIHFVNTPKVQVNESLGIYNALDCACTFEVDEEFVLPPEFEDSYRFTIKLFEPLTFMMTRGIKVNHAELDKTRLRIRGEMADKQAELDRLVGSPLNANSPKQCQNFFYIEKGIKPYLNKEGGITCDDKALQRIFRKTRMPEAKLVQEIRGLQKLIGTYLEIQFDPDNRLRCFYKPRGTKNGRLSSSETVFGTGTNNQNLPQEFKQFLTADDGYVMVEVDKRQAEWVVVAYLSGDANMLKVVMEGKDPHTYTASLMFNVPEEIIKAEAKAVGTSSDQDFIAECRMEIQRATGIDTSKWPRTMSLRQCGKKSNHGLNYDEAYKTFALTNEIPEKEASMIIELYHSIYVGIRNNWYEAVKNQLRKDRTLVNCFGRPRSFLGKWGDDLFRAAYSYNPQSTVVDGLNQGLIGTYYDEDPAVQLLELLAQVHDSILFQFPIAHIKQLYHAMKRVYDHCSPEMTYHGRTFKIATDMKVGLNWGTAHKEHNPLGMREVELGDNEEKFNQTIEGLLNEWENSAGLASGLPEVH